MANFARAQFKNPIVRRIDKTDIESLYAASPPDLSLAMAAYSSGERKIEVGCDVFSSGEIHDEIYDLTSGWVALYKLLEDGRRQILHFALPGAVLGFIQRHAMTYSAQALTPVTVSVIPRRNLCSMFGDNPEICMQFAGLASRDRDLAYDQLSSIGRQSARERVAHLLLELFIRYRKQWPGYRIEEMRLPLTQEHIGDATGLTGVHVNRVLRDLRNDGIASFHYKHLQILNPDRLIDIAGIDPQLALLWVKGADPKITIPQRQPTVAPPITARLKACHRGAVRHNSKMSAPPKICILGGHAR